MYLEKERWLKEKITKYTKPNWPCPTCGIGEIIFPDNWAKVAYSSKSARENPEYLNQFQIEKDIHFAGIILCSNSNCKESISVCGYSSYDTHYAEDGYNMEEVKYYEPKFFFPPLHLFKIDNHCPIEIKQQLVKSFAHFFFDAWAAANSARTALELLMTDQGVQKQAKDASGNIKKLTLHARIELFGKINPELKPFLLAAKWIGNAGSHPNEITKENVLDGYSLIEHAIYELYTKGKRIKMLKRTATAINKSKKPKTIKTKK